MDFAVTSGLHDDLLAAAANDPSSVTAAYDEHKRQYLNTQVECRNEGFDFWPFIVEAYGGGLSIGARRVVAHIAKAWAAREGEEIGAQASELLRRISISVHRENARAVLRRLSPSSAAAPATNPDAWAEPVWQ